jgi:hypothetical protein
MQIWAIGVGEAQSTLQGKAPEGSVDPGIARIQFSEYEAEADPGDAARVLARSGVWASSLTESWCKCLCVSVTSRPSYVHGIDRRCPSEPL